MRRKLRDVIIPVYLFVSFWVVAAAFFSSRAHGETVPRLNDYLAVGHADECAAVRAMVAKARSKLEQSRVALTTDGAEMRTRRSELVDCARKHGIRGLSDSKDKALAAELCPGEFRAWLKPGYGQKISQEDMFETDRHLHRLLWHLGAYCRPLPRTVVADK